MSSLDRAVKRRAGVVGDIISTIGGSPFQQAVEELCASIIELFPDLPTEKTGRLARALGNLQEASLSQTTSTAAATIVAAAKEPAAEVQGLKAAMAAHEEREEQRYQEIIRRFDQHLESHEAGGR